MRPNLDAMVMRFLPDAVISKVAGSMGVDVAPMKSAIETLVPRIIDILAKRTASTSGAREVADVLAARNLEQLGKLAGSLGGVEQDEAARQGGKLAAELLAGTERETLATQVADESGIGAGHSETLLNLLMPVVAGTLLHQQKQDNLDAGGLAAMLAAATGNAALADAHEPRPAPVRPFASPPDDTPPPPAVAEPPPSRLSNAIPNVARIEKRELSPPPPSKDPVGIVTAQAPEPTAEKGTLPVVPAAEDAAKTLKQTRSILDVIRAGKREAEDASPPATARAPVPLPDVDDGADADPAVAAEKAAPVAEVAPPAKVARDAAVPVAPTVAPKTKTVPPPPTIRRAAVPEPSRGWMRWGWVMPLVLLIATSAVWLPYLYEWTNTPEEFAAGRGTTAAQVTPEVQRSAPAPASPSAPVVSAPPPPKQAELAPPAPPPAASAKPAELPKAAAPAADDAADAARKAELEATQRAARDKAAADAEAAARAQREAAARAQQDAAAKAQQEAAAKAQQEATAKAQQEKAAADAEATRKAEAARLAEAARATPPAPSRPPPSVAAQPPKATATAPSQSPPSTASVPSTPTAPGQPAQSTSAPAPRIADAAPTKTAPATAPPKATQPAPSLPQNGSAQPPKATTAAPAVAAKPSAPPRSTAAVGDPQAYCRQVVAETSKANKIHFEFASPRLMSSDIPVLKELVAALKQCPSIKVLVAGHTDSDGHFERNQRLSDNRADAIVDYLSRNGIDDSRLSSVGFGQTKPLMPNTTAANKQLNRRIEFSVVN